MSNQHKHPFGEYLSGQTPYPPLSDDFYKGNPLFCSPNAVNPDLDLNEISKTFQIFRCSFCKSNEHLSMDCTTIGSKSALHIARNSRLCFICLTPGHSAFFCPVEVTCGNSICMDKKKPSHGKLLCKAFQSNRPPVYPHNLHTSPKSSPKSDTPALKRVTRLETTLVCVLDPLLGFRHSLRVLLDSGSTRSFITENCAQNLHLKLTEKGEFLISVFGKPPQSKNCNIFQASVFQNFKSSDYLDFNLISVEKLCKSIQSYEISSHQKQYFEENNFSLADPEASYTNTLDIDILIGQDYYHSIVKDGKLEFPDGLILLPSFNNTYILSGSSTVQADQLITNRSQNPILSAEQIPVNTLTHEEEHQTLETFSNLEALGIGPLESEISPVHENFKNSTIHNGTRWEARLPFNNKVSKLSSNFPQAFSRLVSGHKWRLKHKQQQEAYAKIMSEQLEMGILEKVQALGSIEDVRQRLSNNPNAYDQIGVHPESVVVCYLPHHGVNKSGKKYRVVYDAAARPSKGSFSLNDCLEPGPNLMNSLLHILLKFRLRKYAAKADIAKAFLQVEINIRDRDALRLLWLEGDEVWIYRFARLPFGLTSAPFILAAVMLKQLDESDLDKDTKDKIFSSFYVDDQVWSVDNLDQLLQQRQLSIDIFAKAGMNLRQWNTNCADARDLLQKNEKEELPTSETVLGLRWNTITDTLSINTERILELIGKSPKTKRNFWKFISKLYDPLGLLAPYTVKAKFLTRVVSSVCKGWDSRLPKDIASRVTRWMDDFKHLSDIQLPRHVSLPNCKSQQLVGFCDASGKAFSACVYLVSSNSEQTISNLIMAKTRLRPSNLSSQDIPRLELLGALLLVQLMAFVKQSLPEVSDENVFYFTDSANVLYWIHSGTYNWSTFVANRIKSIRDGSPVSQWFHVNTKENPADLPSRGCTLQELKHQSLWWHGPKFLLDNIHSGSSTLIGYNKNSDSIPEGCSKEMKSALDFIPTPDSAVDLTSELMNEGESKHSKHLVTVHNTLTDQVKLDKTNISPISINICNTKNPLINISKYSSHEKLIGVTKNVLKAAQIFLSKLKGQQRKLVAISNENSLNSAAEILLIRATQLIHLPEMFDLAKNSNCQVSAASRTLFREHKVFLDQNLGILRCTTRLENSVHPFSIVYPILLPKNSMFTSQLIRSAHESQGHSGVAHTLTHLRSSRGFWILGGRKTVKQVIQKCNPCLKVDGVFFDKPAHPPLPDFRVRQARCFSSVGLDMVGPFKFEEIDINEHPSPQRIFGKCYVLMITCAASRAVHLETTRSLAVKDFILALQRFMDIRGVPSHIESDNSKTFIRVNKEFASIFNSKRARHFFQQNRIEWNFYTEHSPWKGGMTERLNSIFKKISRKTFGCNILNFEEFRSMVSYAMSIVNCRPITYVYSDINSEGTQLTPSMLLNGFNLLEPPSLNYRKPSDENELTLSERYKFIEKLKDSFWNLWNHQYLTELYERHVKQGKTPINMRVPKLGQIVLVKDEKLPRRHWKLGRIMNTKISDRDGKIREVTVQCLSKRAQNAEITSGPLPSTFLKKSPCHLVPLEVEPEYFSTDPMVNTQISHSAKSTKRVTFDI